MPQAWSALTYCTYVNWIMSERRGYGALPLARKEFPRRIGMRVSSNTLAFRDSCPSDENHHPALSQIVFTAAARE